jgi:hypothetical protein
MRARLLISETAAELAVGARGRPILNQSFATAVVTPELPSSLDQKNSDRYRLRRSATIYVDKAIRSLLDLTLPITPARTRPSDRSAREGTTF